MEHHIVEIKCRHRKIILISIYRPPNTPITEFLKDYVKLLNKVNKDKNTDIIIGMDHNLDFLKSNQHKNTQNVIEINLDLNYLPCITRPNRSTNSSVTLIDNILISEHLQGRQDSKILIEDLSDHLSSLVTLSGQFLDHKIMPTIQTHLLNDDTYATIDAALKSHD